MSPRKLTTKLNGGNITQAHCDLIRQLNYVNSDSDVTTLRYILNYVVSDMYERDLITMTKRIELAMRNSMVYAGGIPLVRHPCYVGTPPPEQWEELHPEMSLNAGVKNYLSQARRLLCPDPKDNKLPEDGVPLLVSLITPRPYRLTALLVFIKGLELHGGRKIQLDMHNPETVSLIRDVWTDSENPGTNGVLWRTLWKTVRGYHKESEVLTHDEHEEAVCLRKEPSDILTLYRGERRANNPSMSQRRVLRRGAPWPGAPLSWTTDRKQAVWFAQRFPTSDTTGVLYTAEIPRKHYSKIALGPIACRGEEEFVVYNPDKLILKAVTSLRKPLAMKGKHA